jgi:arginine/lysine/histidine/glutamine transport system substrate-binding and permease protein
MSNFKLNFNLEFNQILALPIKRSRLLKFFLSGLGTTLALSSCDRWGTFESPPMSKPQTKPDPLVLKSLTIATEPNFAPFEFKTAAGILQGFDIDLMDEIAKLGNFKITFQMLPFDQIIPALQARRVDGAISAITVTPERSKTVAFSRPYFRTGLAIAIKQNNPQSPSFDSLQQKVIATQVGTTGASIAKIFPGAQVQTFATIPEAIAALQRGQVDAVLTDAPVLLYGINNGTLSGIRVLENLVTEEFYGLALPLNSPYLDRINQALTKIIKNGTYSAIHKKWFGIEPLQELPETALVPLARP